MTDDKKLYDGISKAAWGYFFLYFNININTVSLLPSFVGYLLFLSAIRHLKEEERELSLLQTLGRILLLWHALAWILSWFSISLDGAWQFADIIIGLVNLYFHFQLLTNLASIAAKYQPEGYELDAKLLLYRTVQTVMLTIIMVITDFSVFFSEIWVYVSALLALIYIIIGVCLMKVLFALRQSFK